MKSTRIVAAVVTIAALIGAGCSSSSDSPASSSPSTAPAAPTSAVESSTSAASSASTSVPSSEPAAAGSQQFLFGDTTVELAGVSCTASGDDTIAVVATGTAAGTTMTASIGSPAGDSNVVVTVFDADNSYVRYFLSTTTNSGALTGENDNGHVTLSGKGAAQGYDAGGASNGELETDAASLDVTCAEIAPMAPAPTTVAPEASPDTTG